MSGHWMCAHPCAELRWSCGWCSGSCSLEPTTSSPCLHRTSCKSSTRSHWQKKQRRATPLTLRNPTPAQQEAWRPVCVQWLFTWSDPWPLWGLRRQQCSTRLCLGPSWPGGWNGTCLAWQRQKQGLFLKNLGEKKKHGCWSKLWASFGPAVLLVRVGEGQ